MLANWQRLGELADNQYVAECAPLAAMRFAVELTGDAALIVPLLTVCGASYPFTISLPRRSIVTKKVAWRGYVILCVLRVDRCTSGARRSSIARIVGCSVWSTAKGLLGVRASSLPEQSERGRAMACGHRSHAEAMQPQSKSSLAAKNWNDKTLGMTEH